MSDHRIRELAELLCDHLPVRHNNVLGLRDLDGYLSELEAEIRRVREEMAVQLEQVKDEAY